MTNDYKEQLLKYLTGKTENGTGADEPQFIDKGTVNQNVLDYLNNNFEYGAVIIDSLQQKDIDYILLYGIYWADQEKTTYNGFIYIVTKNLQPVSLITEYSSGTTFRPFLSLNIDEEGYIYGVDNGTEWGSTDYRFIMLNKIISSGNASENFIVKLRQSYYFDNSIKTQIFSLYNGKNLCTKKIGSSDYFIFAPTFIFKEITPIP